MHLDLPPFERDLHAKAGQNSQSLTGLFAKSDPGLPVPYGLPLLSFGRPPNAMKVLLPSSHAVHAESKETSPLGVINASTPCLPVSPEGNPSMVPCATTSLMA